MSDELILTDDEIALLNAARTILAVAKDRCPRTCSGGKVSAAMTFAEEGIFQSLNWAHSYGRLEMTDVQLHNLAPEAVAS